MDNYLPMLVQRQIDETLMATLSAKERNRLEKFDVDKYTLLYTHLLSNDGTGDVSEKMRVLHEKAKLELAQEEKDREKLRAIHEATTSVEPEGHGESQVATSQIGTVERSGEYARIRYLNESGKRQSVEAGRAQGAPYPSLDPVLMTATPQHASMTTLPSSTVRPSVSQAPLSVEDP